MTDLLERARALVHFVRDGASDPTVREVLDVTLRRMDEPLRVAIAGKVKAGKSTLLNALVGERLAPTDAGECTRVVTWYRTGNTYEVIARLRDGTSRALPFDRGSGLEVDLAPVGGAATVKRLDVSWPTPTLGELTLIDTPGLDSMSTDVSARTEEFLNGDQNEQPEAVIYLLRHMHSSDRRFLEAFGQKQIAASSPINAIAILSRADEIGGGRSDAMVSAQRIAGRYLEDPRIRSFAQTVVPVAGLVAETGMTLRQQENDQLAALAKLDDEVTRGMLLSADRFVAEAPDVPVDGADRAALIRRLGLFGVRHAIESIRSGSVTTATDLSRQLVQASGVEELKSLLVTSFAGRRDVLKARAALLSVQELVASGADGIPPKTASRLEELVSSAHEFNEMWALDRVRSGEVKLSLEDADDLETLLGLHGADPCTRLRVESVDEVPAAASAALDRWRRRAESPMSIGAIVETSRIAVRTCEGLLAP